MEHKPRPHRRLRHLYLAYLWPSVAGMIVTSFYVFVDTIFVGRALGSEGLAALELALPLYNVFLALGSLFGLGGATIWARGLGKRKGVVTNALFTGLVVACVFWIASLTFLPQIVQFLGARGNLLPLLTDYVRPLLRFGPFFIFTPLLAPFVTNDQAPGLVMLSFLVAGLCNIALDWLFLFGFGWGMGGAGLATGLAAALNVGILTSRFLAPSSNLKLRGSWRLREATKIMLQGLPSLLGELAPGLVLFLFNQILLLKDNHLGIATYGILANISIICSSVFNGIGQALQPLASVNFAVKRWPRVALLRNVSLLLAFGLGSFLVGLGLLFPRGLATMFNSDPELLMVAARAIRLYFWAFLPMAINTVLGSYYQALGFSRQAILLALGRSVLFVGLGIVTLPVWLGIDGVWLVIPFAETLALGLGLLLAAL